jgi:hypothetical protein
MYFKDPQKLTGRQVNWTTKLQDFDFMIHHVSGESNGRADALSRPEGAEKISAKIGTVLPDWLFAHFLSSSDEEGDDEEANHAQDITNCHNSPTAGHPGVKRTLNLLIRKGRKWPGMRQDVQCYVQGCVVCQKAKLATGIQANPLLIAGAPWEAI